MFYGKAFLKNFAKFTEKHLCQSLFFNKIVGWRPVTLLKKRLQHMYFPVNSTKCLRTSFLQSPSGRLFLIIWPSSVWFIVFGRLWSFDRLVSDYLTVWFFIFSSTFETILNVICLTPLACTSVKRKMDLVLLHLTHSFSLKKSKGIFLYLIFYPFKIWSFLKT